MTSYPIAMTRSAVMPQPQPGDATAARPLHYVVDVQPVFDRYCIQCHGEENPAADLRLTGEVTWLSNTSFANLIRGGYVPGFREGSDFEGTEYSPPKTIGAAIRIDEENGARKSDTRYYISSLRRNGERFANAVRRHWGVENSLHWCLDVTYREDESRVRNRTFTENLAWLRRMTLSLIKQHPGKHSNIMKRRMAGWSVDFLMQVLTGKGT